MKIELYDTTLRDGVQGAGISFSVGDKINIIKALDGIGISYIEAGNPASNPKDMELFHLLSKIELQYSKLTAFGSTCKVGSKPEDSRAISDLIKAGTPAVAIVGKSWLLHVEKVLKTTAEENLRIISESVAYLKKTGKEVFFDAEHFFDGYLDNPDYALNVLSAAKEAGADTVVLCDTNGGTVPQVLGEITSVVTKMLNMRVAIHCHNDNGLAIACSLAAVENRAVQVQGTVNGYGERCGNANLCVIAPVLELKLGKTCLPEGKIKQISALARYISDIANITFDENMPFVGGNAFTHKAGMHIDGVSKIPVSFEHINPSLVGNERKFLISEIAGRAAVLEKLVGINCTFDKDSPTVAKLLEIIKNKEQFGYQYENADGSFSLLLLDCCGFKKSYFSVESFKVVLSEPYAAESIRNKASALIKIKVGELEEITAAEGDGPVNALDAALRKALLRFYPILSEMRLVDYKVRVLDTPAGTGAKVRVMIESSDMLSSWKTVGVSTDIIEASWIALLDSIKYKLCTTDGLINVKI